MQIKKDSFLVTGTLYTILFVIPYVIDPFAYFKDDYQTQFLPAFLEIGRILSSGDYPILSNHFYWGNYLAGEFQFGVFNPFSLLIYFILYQANSLGVEYHFLAMLFSLIHVLFLLFNLRQILTLFDVDWNAQMIASLTLLSSGVLRFWFMPNYIPGLVALSYFSFLIYALCLFYANRRARALVPISIYLVISAGWPFQMLATAVTLFFFVLFLLVERRGKDDLLDASVYILIGAVLSALPLLVMSYYTRTETLRLDLAGHPLQWKLAWRSFLDIINPMGLNAYLWWDLEQRRMNVPMIFTGITTVPLLLVLFYKKWMGRFSQEGFQGYSFILYAAVAILLLSFLPSIGAFRWFFRIMPSAVFLLTVLLGLNIRNLLGSTMFCRAAIAFFVLAAILNLANNDWYLFSHELYLFYVGFFWGCQILLIMINVNIELRYRVLSYAVLVFSIFVFNNHVYLDGRKSGGFSLDRTHLFGTWRDLRKEAVAAFQQDSVQDGVVFVTRGWVLDLNEVLTGAMPLLEGYRTLNGYSAFQPSWASGLACLNYISAFECNRLGAVQAKDPDWGLDMLDMMNVERIYLHSSFTGRMELDEKVWAKDTVGGKTFFQRRAGSERLREGLVVSDRVEIKEVHMKEASVDFHYRMKDDLSGEDGKVLIPWIFYEGYREVARNLSMKRSYHQFIEVALPFTEGFEKVSVRFRPWSLQVGVGAFGLGALALIGWHVMRGREATNRCVKGWLRH